MIKNRSSVRKKVGEKVILMRDMISNNNIGDKKIITNQEYTTNGESLIVVKNTDTCKLTLDNETTEHIKIKSLTETILEPKIGKIDEEWDEILLSKGSCVELSLVEGNYYILSSDGLKLD